MKQLASPRPQLARIGRWLAAALVVGMLQACGGGHEGRESVQAAQEPATALPQREQAANVEGAPIYRFAKISTGAYFYTGSQAEADQIRATMPDFRYEGIAFQQSAQSGGTPVYRFANLSNGGYFYTASVAERDATIVNYPNMRYEGSTFSVAGAGNPAALPVFRLANLGNGAYLFTSNPEERDYAISLGNWRYEGSTFSAVPAGDDGCGNEQTWRVVSGPQGCAACVEVAGTDGGPGGESGGDSVGAGAAWSQVRNMLARVTKPDGSLLGEAAVADGMVSIYPGCYRGPYVVEFVAQANAQYFDEARLAWRPVPAANARLRVAMPGYLVGRDLSANPFTEAAYQYVIEYNGGQAGLSAANITAANERVRAEANAKLLGGREFGARVKAVLREQRADAALAAAASAGIQDITRLPRLINDTTGADALGNTPRGVWAAQLAAVVKAAYSYSGNTLLSPALDFTNHLVKDILDNGAVNPETTVDKQTYGLDSPARVQVAIEEAADRWGTPELVTQVRPVNPAGCSGATVNWVQSGNACSAAVSGQYAHQASVLVVDATGPLRGGATAVCSNGTWVATGGCSTEPLRSCAGTVLEWGAGTGADRCTGSVSTVPSGASVNLSDVTGSSTGSAVARCVDGTWSFSSSTCQVALSCPAVPSLIWPQNQGSNYQCEGALPQTASGGTINVLDTAGPVTGSVTARCNNGVWSLASEVCQPPYPVSFDGGYGFSVAVLSDGSLWAWGRIREEDGPLIVADYGTTPVRIGTGYRAVSAGNHHVLALRSDGSLWAWGYNSRGQVGDNTTTLRAQPVRVGEGFETVSAGSYHSLAIRSDGSLWAWGENFAGQIGDNSTTRRLAPVQVGTGYRAVAAGSSHSLGLRTDGSLWAWGDNAYGQLGDAGCCDRWTPGLVGNGYTAIAAGGDHSLAIRSGGSLWAWGANYSGQLGNLSWPNQPSPVQVGNGFRSVAAGSSHTLAVGSDDSLWAWGSNTYGQVGHGGVGSASAPAQVGTGYRSAAAGGTHSLAIRTDNSLWAWGAAPVGDGTTTDRSTPVRVTFDTGGSLQTLPAMLPRSGPASRALQEIQ